MTVVARLGASAALAFAMALTPIVDGASADSAAVQPLHPSAGQGSPVRQSMSPATPPPAGPAAAGSDFLVTGVSTTSGYELYRADKASGWQWRAQALLAPGGADGEPWIGQQCVTGDGTAIVAVVAPWHVVNQPEGAGNDRGGTAVVVNLVTGAERVIATGVSLYYFNPGCGTGPHVVLTRYLAADQRVTQLVSVNSSTARVTGTQTIRGELTSALPVGRATFAASGDRLVRVTGGRVVTLGRLPSVPFGLRPDSSGGVDFLTFRQGAAGGAGKSSLTVQAAGTTTAWRWQPGRPPARLGGRAAASVRTAVPNPADGEATSVHGSVVAVRTAQRTNASAGLLPAITTAAGRLIRAAAAPPATPLAVLTQAYAADPRGDLVRPVGTRAAAAAANSTPACAVPRDNVHFQVPQPSNEQINWAIRQAVIDKLPARAAGFDNLAGGSYNPESDFPQPALAGANTGGAHVPELLVDAILAQESNWNQASWHAPVGMPGDPLVADYYGDYGDTGNPINYSLSDCGYGLGQLTTIMRSGAVPQVVQNRVAVDYAENVAAVVQLLAQTWNQLIADGISVNGEDPNWLENWYDTAWAYNSGVEPVSAAYGNTTGCTPGPACTDNGGAGGNWGLGWANNPQNPVYPPKRQPFLTSGYGDAAHPSDWPYQELILGWMGTPLLRSEGGTTYAAYAPAANYIGQPPYNAFCAAADNCNPTDPAQAFCQLSNDHCWWHGAVTFDEGCPPQQSPMDYPVCTIANMSETPNSAEPVATDPEPPVCTASASGLPANAYIVTEEALPQNGGNSDLNDVPAAVRCPATPTDWNNSGTFAVSNAFDATGNPESGQRDLHQLGAGFGGHMFFTHLWSPSDSADAVTGVWTPTLPAGTADYQIEAFIPDIGASAAPATYGIYTQNGTPPLYRTISQADYGNRWVSLGVFALTAGSAEVFLSNSTTAEDDGSDLAFNAMAFIPRPGTTLVHHTVDAFANFSENQSLNGNPGPDSWLAGDFASDSSLKSLADSTAGSILQYPACTDAVSGSCAGTNLETAMRQWKSAADSDTYPVQWLNFGHAPPPNPLPSNYLSDPTTYKIRASLAIDYLLESNGQIDPNSYTVTATNETGITDLPPFILSAFRAISLDYGIPAPDLAYTAPDLQFDTGNTASWDAGATGEAPGREYAPQIQATLINNGTCLQVQDITGGTIGWKPMLLDPAIPSAVDNWLNEVDAAVSAKQAPQAVENLADKIHQDFFSQPLNFPNGNPSQWALSGSIFYFAPAIWLEEHMAFCGQNPTPVAEGNTDPVTNKQQLVDSSYMPDLYLAVDGKYVGKYGSPTNGAPVQPGDWTDFSSIPPAIANPWNICYIGPDNPAGSGIEFVSRRDGNPWNLPLANPGDLPSSVGWC